MAAAYMCIAASDRPTITGASPSFGAESATATRFFFVSTSLGRANGNPYRLRIQPLVCAPITPIQIWTTWVGLNTVWIISPKLQNTTRRRAAAAGAGGAGGPPRGAAGGRAPGR